MDFKCYAKKKAKIGGFKEIFYERAQDIFKIRKTKYVPRSCFESIESGVKALTHRASSNGIEKIYKPKNKLIKSKPLKKNKKSSNRLIFQDIHKPCAGISPINKVKQDLYLDENSILAILDIFNQRKTSKKVSLINQTKTLLL